MAKRRSAKNAAGHRVLRQERSPELRLDSLFTSLGRIEIVLLISGVLLLLVLIYTIHTILSPFLALGAILFILYPLRRYILARNVMWLAIILFSLWFLDSISNILAPFVVSLVFAYMLNPVVDLFERWSVARWVSALILILLFISGLALIFFFVLPVALAQFEGIVDTLSKILTDFQSEFWDSKLIRLIERYGISVNELRTTFASQLTPKFEDLVKALLKGLGALVSSISSFLTQIFYLILIPFLTFYFLTDFPKIGYRFLKLFPRRRRERAAEYLARADDLIGHYLRGALIVALMQGVAVSVLFSAIGMKYALLLGLLACIFDLVPYFGLVAIMVLSAIVATISGPPVLLKLALAVGSIGFLHIIEIVLLSPKIVGGRVGLHPLLIILSLLIFMYFLGFVGLLIAVPTTALVILFVRDWEARKRGANLRGEPPMTAL
jgi:predicted PurR-regulated permease PerM